LLEAHAVADGFQRNHGEVAVDQAALDRRFLAREVHARLADLQPRDRRRPRAGVDLAEVVDADLQRVIGHADDFARVRERAKELGDGVEGRVGVTGEQGEARLVDAFVAQRRALRGGYHQRRFGRRFNAHLVDPCSGFAACRLSRRVIVERVRAGFVRSPHRK
jgi:hypothetical protein